MQYPTCAERGDTAQPQFPSPLQFLSQSEAVALLWSFYPCVLKQFTD